jgi:hypothetical protein
MLLVLGSCSLADTTTGDPPAPGIPAPTAPIAGRSVALSGPALVDTDGIRLTDEHADVVRAVHRALAAGDLDALGGLYAGDDWATQAALLAQPPVRHSVLDALATPPANLGEGYLYPGFSADPGSGYRGYQTAFFLDYDPPQLAAGPLRWRGIAPPASATPPAPAPPA